MTLRHIKTRLDTQTWLLTGFSLICMLAAPTVATAQSVSVTLDFDRANAVLEEVCSGEEIDEAAIRASAPARDMVNHFAKFRDDFTMDNYVAARRAAAQCETHESDIFRFADIIERRDAIRTEIETLASSGASYSEDASGLIRRLSPADVQFNGTATVMLGTPSCGGWSVGPVFYLDYVCLSGDPQGMLYLIAHESYHGVQDHFFHQTVETAGPIAKLLHEAVIEGSALSVADFSEIEDGGRYTELNQRVIRTNQRRMQENFDLFGFMIEQLRNHGDEETYDRIYRIGFSGLFDSPFYSVGAEVVTRVEAAHGAEAVICLMRLEPQYLFAAYSDLQYTDDSSEAPQWSAIADQAIRALGIDTELLANCLG